MAWFRSLFARSADEDPNTPPTRPTKEWVIQTPAELQQSIRYYAWACAHPTGDSDRDADNLYQYNKFYNWRYGVIRECTACNTTVVNKVHWTWKDNHWKHRCSPYDPFLPMTDFPMRKLIED